MKTELLSLAKKWRAEADNQWHALAAHTQTHCADELEAALARAEQGALECGHHVSLMLISAETGQPLYCELCDALTCARDHASDAAEWKSKALASEETIDRMADAFNRENGPTFMGEPVLPPSPASGVGAERAIVLRNTCTCHPETCCCADYKVKVDGKFLVAGTEQSCKQIAAAFNAAPQPEAAQTGEGKPCQVCDDPRCVSYQRTLHEADQAKRADMASKPFREWQAEGWVLAYEPDTRFIGLSHPQGGKMSVAEIHRNFAQQGIGEAVIAALAATVPEDNWVGLRFVHPTWTAFVNGETVYEGTDKDAAEAAVAAAKKTWKPDT